MKAIRGATTVAIDNEYEIKSSVSELLLRIKEKNNLNNENIICIMFSNTADIRSFYPAKAAREAGFFNCALYSSLEPDIDGSLKKCIRVMILAETDGVPQHVYLSGAAMLRKDISKNINIAIDGPAGSGKSTVSKIIAKKLNVLYLDTGAMYRACAYACITNNINIANENDVNNIMQSIMLDIIYKNGEQFVLFNGENITDKIRTPEISMLASKVSAYASVRTKMVNLQRKLATEKACVLDGRDIGTNVLPNADFKFYLTASAEVRAKRRADENRLKGINQPYEEVLADIITRDNQDKTRKIAPLSKAPDAIEVDTGNMSIDEVTEYILKIIQEKI